MITLRAVIYMMTLVAPGAEHTGSAHAFAQAVTTVANLDPPPPGETSEQFAAELLIYGYDEGRYCSSCARGDGGRAVCTGQVWARSAEHARALEGSMLVCVRNMGVILRLGAQFCPKNHGAPYCGGCGRPAPESIARRREERARAMVAKLNARTP